VGRNSAWLLFALALGLLVLPIWWVLAAVVAAIWHEACHYFALRLCGGRPLGLQAGLTGAVMEIDFLNPVQELFCAMAGPLGSLLLLFFAKWLPRTAICAGFQGIYNLLPLFPLDGGRIVRCLLELVFPQKLGENLCSWLDIFCLFGLALLALYGCFGLHLGLTPLLVGIGIICRIKIPCKPWRNSVQWWEKIL
jgi:stage IV sporulation protein FB